MARPKYRITAADLLHVGHYLSDKLRNYSFEFSEGVSITVAEKKYDVAIGHKSNAKRAEAMNAWCEKYLSTAEWNQLKAAIRKRRARWERYGESTTITVSTKAHEYLVKISERDKVTYNDILSTSYRKHGLVVALSPNGGRGELARKVLTELRAAELGFKKVSYTVCLPCSNSHRPFPSQPPRLETGP